jgi:hypothetical protein
MKTKKATSKFVQVDAEQFKRMKAVLKLIGDAASCNVTITNIALANMCAGALQKTKAKA